MHIQVSGKQIDIGDSLRRHVEDRLVAGVAKYFDSPIEAAVVFARDGHEFRCDCSVHAISGMTLFAQGRGGEIYASFDLAAERMEKRLRRYKRRLRDHKPRAPEPGLQAQSFVIAATDEDMEETELGEPAVVAEAPAEVPSLTVGEAVMRLDLAEAAALLFRNRAHGALNVVYRRADGNIGWVDPSFDPNKKN